MGRVYVQVGVIANVEGEWIPLRVYWVDGRTFEIEKTTEIRSIGKGSTGKRYTCLIKGKPKYLYHEDSKWFVEVKQ